MATILIVDDRAANREFLVTLLGYGGHRLLEAGDGAEGLAAVRAERPDLVIADILMPTMDGYEFVRQLRADPSVAGTRVVFFTAHYHEPEARRLAAACGVTDVLTKPCEPEVVLKTVDIALGHFPISSGDPPPPANEFDREHLHLLTDKLSRQADEARRTSERLTVLVELGLQLGSERDPARLLQVFCDAAREIVGARYAVVGIPDGSGNAYRFFLTGGMDLATTARVGRPGPLQGVLGSVLAAGRCFRASNHGGLDAAGVPASFPPASALLAAPIVSPVRVHGWVCLLDKVGGDSFTDEDERLARMLGAQVGRIYENGSLYADLLRHSSKLAEEVAERQRGEAALRESEGRFRLLIESIPHMVWLTRPDGATDYLNQRGAAQLGIPPEAIHGSGWLDLLHPDDAGFSRKVWEDAIAAGAPYRSEYRVRQADGSYRWYLAQGIPIRGLGGVIERWVGTWTDIDDSKRAAESLQRTTDLLRAVAEGTTDAVFVKDSEGRYLLFNEAAARFVGKPVAEVLGRDDTTLFGLDEARMVMARDRRVMETGGVLTEEETLTAGGATRTYLATKGPYRDERGNVAGVLGISRDITASKRAEAERDSALRQLRVQIERMPLAYLLFDADLRVIEWNATAERIFGYSKAEILGMGPPFNKILPAEAWPQGEEILRRIRAGDMAAHAVNQNLTKDGRTIVCEWSNTPLLGDDGTFLGLVSLAQDVTARRASEEQLRLQDRAIRAVTQGILITDPNQPDNPVVFASPGFERITGYRAAEAVGRNCRFLQGKDTDKVAVSRMRAAIGAGEECTAELLNYRQDGTPFWNELSVSPVRDDSGTLTHFVGVQTDVTSRRSLEEQFRQSQKMEAVGRLAGGVAHDFNNLLTIINGYGEVLLDELPPDNPNRDLIREMVAAGERAAGLTRQLLAFSRKSIIEPKVLDLKLVVADVERMLRRVVGEDVQLTVFTDPEVGAVRADPGQLEQVLLNLVVNARDAMPTGGKLTIAVRNADLDEAYARTHPDARPGPYVQLAVTDTGFGIDAATIARIFEPFFSTKGEHGTGLGLATVHGIVKQGGGHVAVESEVGRGTTFRVYLPRIEKPQPAPGSRIVRSTMPRGGETILLVEDEDGVRALTRHVLRNCGYNVLEAREGIEAVRLAEEHRGQIDLLLTDVVMPRMGGREVTQRVSELHPRAKVLFLSGYTDDAVVRHGILEAEVAFLQKPFTPASLAAKVREVLDTVASHP